MPACHALSVLLHTFLLLFALSALAAPVTTLVPSQPFLEEPASGKKNGAKSPPGEVDILMSLLHPFELTGEAMDMPQLFAAMYYPPDFDPASMQPELINLLGDVEEIRYLDTRAWGANVAINKPGLYQFILEAKPWWDRQKNMYMQQQVKVALPAFGVDNGWNVPFGQSFEIMPLTRPFGLSAPALFSGRLLLDGKPLVSVPVRMGRINMARNRAGSKWSRDLESLTNSDGQFSFVLNQPGWWYCQAAIRGAPLKGLDGEMRESERSTVFWLHVDETAKSRN